MDSEAIAELARRLSRDSFAAKLTSWFLAVKEEETEISRSISFQTKVVDFDPSGMKNQQPLGWEILPLVKAPSNPYPDRISVGRARNCDVVMRDPTVSKLHGHFRVREGGFDLVDLGSPNGTRLNGKPLEPNQPTPVALGDTIHFGVVSTQLVDAGRLYDLLQFG